MKPVLSDRAADSPEAGQPFDVVIAGGGMVGLSLALALYRQAGESAQACRIAVVESAALPVSRTEPVSFSPSFDARSTALSWGSVQFFAGLGLAEELTERACPIHKIHVSQKGHFGRSLLTAEENRVPALGYVVENRVLGAVLVQALGAILASPDEKKGPQLALFDQHRVQQVVLAEDGQSREVVCEPLGEGHPVVLQARLLVACDGAHSPCREMLGIATTEEAYGQSAVIANVAVDCPHQQIAYERFTPNGPLALLPLTEQRFALVWTRAGFEAGEVMALEDPDFLAQLQQQVGLRTGRFVRVGERKCFPLAKVVAREQALERALLMGNAAHSLHPVAGQGFNLCLRDVEAFVQHYCSATDEQRARADRPWLQQYVEARLPDQQATIQFSHFLVKLFGNRLPGAGLARSLGLTAFDLVPVAKWTLAKQGMGL